MPTSWLWKRNSTPLLALREDFSEELTDDSLNTLRAKLDHIFSPLIAILIFSLGTKV